MKRRNAKRSSPETWIEYAEADLKLAKIAIEYGGISPAIIGFHAQQACEKALKAVLVNECVAFAFSHDLDLLIDEVEKTGLEVPVEVELSGDLTPFAVQLRYPGEGDDIEENEIRSAIATAEAVVKWTKKIIASNGKHKSKSKSNKGKRVK